MRKPRERPHKPKAVHPESLMMSYGYRPELSEGAIKPPIFQTSTFVMKSAAEGKEMFSYAYGLAERDPKRAMSLIYSRLNNPDLEILENRLTLWDEAEASLLFASGMAAISTTLLALVPIGHSVVFARPVYGGTDYFFEHILPDMGIPTRPFPAGAGPEEAERLIEDLEQAGTPCRLIYLETPANPTNTLTDIAALSAVAHHWGALSAVDNTLLGPLYQQPLKHGADLVLYSATKSLGGHSDVVLGAVLGAERLLERVRLFRSILGSTADPHAAWLLLRSLETYKLRATCARKNAEKVARFLAEHPKVARVHFPGLTGEGESIRQREIYDRQCTGPGALISFELAHGGEREAFQLLDHVHLIQLAVSLGGNESLIEHPATMTHADIPILEQAALGITPSMIRLSVGIEHPDDLIADLALALEAVGAPEPVGVGREDAVG